jgi:membrane protein involved in colicin uptake
MLSTQYRLRLEAICAKIAQHQEVSLEDMIWAEKLAKANRSAATILRQARRKAENPNMQEGDLDDFLNQLDIGGLGNERFGISGFDSVDDIVDFFSEGREKPDDWRQRD